jgi:hypothetical protein
MQKSKKKNRCLALLYIGLVKHQKLRTCLVVGKLTSNKSLARSGEPIWLTLASKENLAHTEIKAN